MTKIKNLQMAETVCNDMRIKITESFFGLCCKAIFMPTNSKIDAKTLEYSPEIGGRLNTILNMPHDKLVSTLENFRPVTTVNGNYLLELCTSRDGNFAALQLFRYVSLKYSPVTDVIFFEEDDARLIKNKFV